MFIELIKMGHAEPPTPAVTDSAIGDVFVNDNKLQQHSRATNMWFYSIRYRVRKWQFLLYWMAVEHNLADYFTKHHPTSHHWSRRSTYLFLAVEYSKYACYMSPNELLGCVEALPTQVNLLRIEKVFLPRGKETDDRRMEKNSPIRQTHYRWR